MWDCRPLVAEVCPIGVLPLRLLPLRWGERDCDADESSLRDKSMHSLLRVLDYCASCRSFVMRLLKRERECRASFLECSAASWSCELSGGSPSSLTVREDSASDSLALRRVSFSLRTSSSFCKESNRSVRLFRSEITSELKFGFIVVESHANLRRLLIELRKRPRLQYHGLWYVMKSHPPDVGMWASSLRHGY